MNEEQSNLNFTTGANRYLISDQEARIKSLVDLLEFEIKRLDSEERQPGWTTWALSAALGSLTWLGLSVIENTLLSATNVGYLFLALSLAQDFLILSADAISPAVAEKDRAARYRPSSAMLGHSRTLVVLFIIRFAALSYIAHTNSHVPEGWAKTGAIIYSDIIILILLLILAMSFASLVISLRQTRPGSVKIFCIALTFLVGSSLIAITQPVICSLTFKVQEWKLAGLSVVWVGVLILLCRGRLQKPLVSTLIDVRRKLSTNEIDYETAKQQFSIAIEGLKISDMLQKEISSILDGLRMISSTYNTILQELGALNKTLAKNPGEKTSEEKTLINAVVESAKGRLKESRNKVDEVLEVVTRFKRRARWMTYSAPDSIKEIDEIASHLIIATKDEQAKLNANSDRIDEELEKLLKSSGNVV